MHAERQAGMQAGRLAGIDIKTRKRVRNRRKQAQMQAEGRQARGEGGRKRGRGREACRQGERQARRGTIRLDRIEIDQIELDRVGCCLDLLPSSRSECRFPVDLHGDWLFFETDRKERVTISADNISFSLLGQFICKSKHWSINYYKLFSVYTNGW